MKTRLIFRNSGLLGLAAAVLCFGSAASATAARAPRFVIRNLGPSPEVPTQAHSINDRGEVVGEGSRPFLYSRGKITELNVGQYGSALDINDRGQIIGYASGAIHTFLYDDGEVTDVKAAAGQQVMLVRAINNRGAIVGHIQQFTGPPAFQYYDSAFVFAGGKFRLLDPLPGAFSSGAFDINNRGQVAGHSSVFLTNGSIVGHAVIWDSRGIRDLGTLPGTTNSIGTGINDRGQVTGFSDFHGFIYSGGRMISLGNLPGHFYNRPLDINNFGHIVGESNDAQHEDRRAFLYANGVIHDLNDLIPRNSGWVLKTAAGINDRGEIVGSGRYRGLRRAFLLQPIHRFRFGRH
jgi:probable HAF family extracellular repeat protein